MSEGTSGEGDGLMMDLGLHVGVEGHRAYAATVPSTR